jgi:hypothetical protein
MTLPSRKTLLANGLSLIALGWIYGGDLVDALQARSAEVAAFTALPSVTRPALVLVLGAVATLVVAWGLLRRQQEGFKGYRLLPILVVGALFADLVFAESRVPLDSTDVASMALQRFQQAAQPLTTREVVPADPRALQPLLAGLGAPPYLVRGEKLSAYSLQVRENCEGPVREAPAGTRPGTLFYCVAPERKGAWVTVVGLPAETRFGLPAVLSVGGEARFVLVRPQEAEEGGDGEDGAPLRDVSGPPEAPGAPDGGGGAGAVEVQP